MVAFASMYLDHALCFDKINTRMREELIYQTVGYTDQNRDPTEEHINQSLISALRIPVTGRTHLRIWLPHRVGGRDLVGKVWDWFTTHSTGAVSHSTIRNCGHVVIFMLAPEDKDPDPTYADTQYDRKIFVDGPFGGETRIEGQQELMHFIRHFASTQYITSMEYAKQLHRLGYDVGFQANIVERFESFNEIFNGYFNTGPVLPMMMVYAGTEASALRHSFQRRKINISTVKDTALIQPDWLDGFNCRPTESMPDNVGEDMYKWSADKSDLIPLSGSEIKALDYKKYT